MDDIPQGVCYVFAAAPVEDYGAVELCLGPKDYLICADGGQKHLKALGLTPDVLLGDFDSSLPEEGGYELLRYPPEKDDTDLMIALKLGLQKGYRDFRIYGGLGGRIDHTLAAIQGLSFLKDHGANGMLWQEKNEVWLLYNETASFPRRDVRVSLLCFSDRCTGVTTEGLQYPLQDAELTSGFPLGVSNEFSAPTAKVTVKTGKLLLIFSKD